MYHALDNSVAGNPGDVPTRDGFGCRAVILRPGNTPRDTPLTHGPRRTAASAFMAGAVFLIGVPHAH